MNKLQNYLCILCLSILLGPMACREFYEPEVTAIDHSYLVVEGFLEVGGGVSQIRLSRTVPLNAEASTRPIFDAVVRITSENGTNWLMSQVQQGLFELNTVLPEHHSYSVEILTPGAAYRTDWIVPVLTPDDLELGYSRRDGSVSIYAATTGNEQAKYFIWDFEEDWEFRSAYPNFYYYDREMRIVRATPFNQLVEKCYLGYKSTRIILESSERFQNNRITRREIQRIDTLSEKLGERYSILVRQRALDRDAFEFWEAMRKNSDDIGGIFSPLPSIIGSNIQQVENQSQPVIGYISAGKTVERRMYIDRRELGAWPTRIDDYRYCRLDTVLARDYENNYVIGNMVPVIPICEGASCFGYLSASVGCVDCTLRGSGTPPSFWEPYVYIEP